MAEAETFDLTPSWWWAQHPERMGRAVAAIVKYQRPDRSRPFVESIRLTRHALIVVANRVKPDDVRALREAVAGA